LNKKSRMMGDYHVRFCERLGVKFPLSTRHKTVVSNAQKKEPMNKLIIIAILGLISLSSLYCQKAQSNLNSESRLYVDSIYSKNLGEYRKHNVYLPYGYSDQKKYKVIYATDGDESLATTFIKSALDSLIGNNLIKPIIYIGSHSNSKNIASTSMQTNDGMQMNIQYRNFEYVEEFAVGGPFKELANRFKNHMLYFKDELIPQIEEEFNINIDQSDRIFYGVSNGAGFGANLLNKHPRIIGTYVCYSPLGSNVEKNIWNKKLNYPKLYIQYGTKEDDLFKKEAENLNKKYKESNSFCDLRTFNGGHDYEEWNRQFPKTLIEILRQ